jgi:alpha-N-acetylglucosamine transferase
MKQLIYQVCLGDQKQSKLYQHCINSVADYAKRIDAKHIVQTEPILKIMPDVKNTNRSVASYQKHGGFLPIYEKENAFDMLDEYDQIAIVDADIYVRQSADNIFNSIEQSFAFGAVVEREMPITEKYKKKIRNYSNMQYTKLNSEVDFKRNELGFEFANMGMIVINSKQFKPYLSGQNAKEFISRTEFKRFVDGVGDWKWSTDQTLLNFFVKKYNVPFKHMHWKWNGLYSVNTKINQCNFVHFFLKDHLPSKGEDVSSLMREINK